MRAPTPVIMSSSCCKWCIDALSRMTTEQGFKVAKSEEGSSSQNFLTHPHLHHLQLCMYASSIPPVVITPIALIRFPPTLRVCQTRVRPLKVQPYARMEFLLSEPVSSNHISMSGSNYDISAMNYSALLSSFLYIAMVMPKCWIVRQIVDGCTTPPVASSSFSLGSLR